MSPKSSKTRSEFMSTGRSRFLAVAGMVLMSGVLGLLSAGCSDDSTSQSDQQAGIYGVYEGTSSDYTQGGAASTTVDNGFAVDGVSRSAPRIAVTGAQDKQKDLLAPQSDTLDSSSDTNAKKNDLDKGKNSLSQGSDPLSRGGDFADGEGPKTGLDSDSNDSNFYSYWLVGHIENATMSVSVNGVPISIVSGDIDMEISKNVHPSINKVTFLYTPLDSTARAHITIMRGAQPPLPLSASFDSVMDAGLDYRARSITKTSFFVGE